MLGKVGIVVIAVVACGAVVFAAMSRDDGGSEPTSSKIIVVEPSRRADDELAEQWSAAPALSPQFVNINEPVAAPLPEGESAQ